ncbi:MAG: hypothetical protein ACTHPD_08650 [Rhizomicrobium sp.]
MRDVVLGIAIAASFLFLALPTAYFFSGRTAAIYAGALGITILAFVFAHGLTRYLDGRDATLAEQALKETAPPIVLGDFAPLTVGITGISIEELPNLQPRLRVLVTNHGSDVAKKIDARAFPKFYSGENRNLPKRGVAVFDKVKPLTRSQFMLFANETRGTSFPLDPIMIQQLHLLQKTFIVLMKITYETNTIRHETIECFRCISRDEGKSLTFETYGNCAEAY